MSLSTSWKAELPITDQAVNRGLIADEPEFYEPDLHGSILRVDVLGQKRREGTMSLSTLDNAREKLRPVSRRTAFGVREKPPPLQERRGLSR